MDDDRRKLYCKKGTGTVPKAKYRNNAPQNRSRAHQNVVSNNLSQHIRTDLPSNRGFYTMNSIADDYSHNDVNLINEPVSQRGGRRDSASTIPKCDNTTKYPDKKQIEDKLTQIRDYIRITSSLMATLKNSDEQSNEDDTGNLEALLNDLKDSEAKLVAMLDEDKVENAQDNGIDTSSEPSTSGCFSNTSQKNDFEQRVEDAKHEIQLLCEQHNSLMSQHNALLSLKQKAENKLRDARQTQERLLQAQHDQKLQNRQLNMEQERLMAQLHGLDVNDVSSSRTSDKNLFENDDDDVTGSCCDLQENLNAQVQMLQDKVSVLRNSNDSRTGLIHVLDKRDAQLQTEHMQLQEKLRELQTKKQQVDKLVMQLQNLDETEDDEDIGIQVRKICAMKEQLSKLQGMYELVKNTEPPSESHNSDVEEENAKALPVKTDNVTQSRVKDKERNTQQHGEKQLNINFIVDPDTGLPLPSNFEDGRWKERERLKQELEAKKREMEEIMSKRKGRSSHINRDPGFDGEWPSEIPCQNRAASSERYSSDEYPPEETNEYLEVEPEVNNAVNFSRKFLTDRGTRTDSCEPRQDAGQTPEYVSLRNMLLRTPERGVRGTSVGSAVNRERSVPRKHNGKSETKKQIEMIRNLCDSILGQPSVNARSNLPHFRNNLSSPLYTEPQPLNLVSLDTPWVPTSGYSNNNEVANYQSLLATNTLQTQAFMLNTLNQCCQMLWLQQRELAALRNAMAAMQERFDQSDYPSSPHYSHPPSANPTPHSSRAPSQFRPPPNNQKTNSVSAACSLPNLNQGQPNNSDAAFAVHNNNMHDVRLIDNYLNNNNNAAMLHGMEGNRDAVPWNRQALNNQVAPGNRANNYWDNFRSYSRQNLLSTKSNEGSSLPERSTSGLFPMPLQTKMNSLHQETATTSEETTPIRQRQFKNTYAAPSSVEVNRSRKTNELSDFSFPGSDTDLSFPSPAPRKTSSNNSEDSDTSRKPKLFEELRENVYKEVASLISANKGRPHFLIQLFRDLQFVSSDPLRCRTLQSIHSLVTSDSQPTGAENSNYEQESEAQNFSTQTHTAKPYSTRCERRSRLREEDLDLNDYFKDVWCLLDIYHEDVLQADIITALTVLINNKAAFLPNNSAAALKGVIEQHKGKKVAELKMQFLKVLMEGYQEKSDIEEGSDVSFDTSTTEPLQLEENNPPPMHNEDLAEADQSHLENEDEGAVGGLIPNALAERTASMSQVASDELEISVMDFPIGIESEFSEQGLDQVPTRLTNGSRSRSVTPNTDKNCGKKGNSTDHF